jgi:hypothetical protein
MAYKTRNLVKDALLEIGATDPLDPLEEDDLATGLGIVTMMASTMAGQRLALFTAKRVSFALTSNQGTNTIGVGGSFDTTAALGAGTPRPSWIGERATVTPVGDTLDYPLTPYRNRAEYDAEPLKTQTQLWPLKFLYEPSWPLGLLTWWPKPTTAAVVNLRLLLPLVGALTADTVLDFPPGYSEYWKYSLAKRLCIPYRKKASAELLDALREARGIVFRNNEEAPSPAKLDSWAGGSGGAFNIYTNRYQETN